ncbi:hypothetical protein [Fundidesulfovibrio putealis]|uniref:hypothetical protein n=1 Tax=Fundidesulfovibrio putealis TaxID=270496 RepID=UPI000406D084|nr:hypothetical protein [Fundidesulfovibrio putealis]KAF0234879.1 MAG: hypothetical protein FD177_442 [Desulfovibrionaceae bacterium]
MVLGKGIKGGELFKRTDVTEEEGGQSSQIRDGEKAQGREDANPDLRKSGKAKKQKGDDDNLIKDTDTKEQKGEVRKTVVFSDELYDRLRSYCYNQRMKEAWAVREALDEYLRKHGF